MRGMVGTFVSRELVHALEGDATAAIMFAQASWIQDHFEGAWSLTADWWVRFFGLSKEVARRALRRLESAGWLVITRRGTDSAWWVEVTGKATDAIATAEHRMLDALLWEVRGERCEGGSKSSNTPDQYSPNQQVDDLSTGAGQPVDPHLCVKTGSEIPELAPGEPGQGQLSQILVELYPHPTNRGARARVPSAIQVDTWLGELARGSSTRSAVKLVQVAGKLVESARGERLLADREPERFRFGLKTWLLDFHWTSTIATPATETRTRATTDPQADMTDEERWAELERRGDCAHPELDR